MSFESRLDQWARGWRGPLLAAALALLAGLPGALGLPPLDRDESRFAEASAQMLETGDFVSPRFQAEPRFKKPAGIYWLQAATVEAVSQVEDRGIWAYRIPSLLGAMLAAGACVWGAAAFLSPGAALLSGLLLASGFMLSTEAAIAATDAVLCGAVTLAMAALGRLYLAARGGPRAGRGVKAALWAGLALSILVKGPIGPMVAALALVALCLWDRRVGWLGTLGWGWGLIGLAAVVGPWALAVTVATDGGFWGAAVGGDLAPKLAGEAEGHGAPPGYYLLLSPLLTFPAVMLLPAGLVAGWRARAEPATRFALCWLAPSWLVFEATPTKLIHYTLPLYGALAWLMAASLAALRAEERPVALERAPRAIGAGLVLLAAIAFAAAPFVAMGRLRDFAATPFAIGAALAFAAAGGAGAILLWRRRGAQAVVVAALAASLGHGLLAGGVAPALRPLWISRDAAGLLAAAGASPWQGVVPGPVAVAGYAEPSLVFLLGADTELGDAPAAARALAQGRPAIVEAREDPAFQAALAARGLRPRLLGAVSGLDYSKGRAETLRVYAPAARGDATRRRP